MPPFISICVPAYKKPHYLRRLFESIRLQTFRDFEIIVTDNSGDDTTAYDMIRTFEHELPIRYFRNTPPVTMAENWNNSIAYATGTWIKMMHDDDWFTSPNSLQRFVDGIKAHPESNFFFAAYNNIYEDENDRLVEIRVKPADEKGMRDNLLYLFRTNYIGNPSCTIYRKNDIIYDKAFSWVVDFEFYIRYLSATGNKFTYIDEPLINIGMNGSQVTRSTFRVNKVEVPENHTMLANFGFGSLKNIYVYDYFWRLYRNLKIRDLAQLSQDGYNGPLSPVLKSMIDWQKKFPLLLLRFGPFSKSLMLLHYLTHSYAIRDSAIHSHC